MTQADEPTSPPPPSLVIPIAFVGALVGAAACYGLTLLQVTGGQAVPVLVVGPIVGGLVRLLTKGVSSREAIVVAILALCGAIAGFIWADYHVWSPFMLDAAIQRILSLIGSVVFGGTTWLAYIIALRR